MKITRRQLRKLIIEAATGEKPKNLDKKHGTKIVQQINPMVLSGSKYKVIITCKDGEVTNIKHESVNIKPNPSRKSSKTEILKHMDIRVKRVIKKEKLSDGKYIFNFIGGV